MNEEEKERIKHLIERCNECKLNACITCDICWSEVQAIEKLFYNYEQLKLQYEQCLMILKGKQETIVEQIDVIKKQQAEIEKLKADNNHQWEERCNLVLELKEQDKIINLMAERLTAPYYSKENVIDYYKKEIEKC